MHLHLPVHCYLFLSNTHVKNQMLKFLNTVLGGEQLISIRNNVVPINVYNYRLHTVVVVPNTMSPSFLWPAKRVYQIT